MKELLHVTEKKKKEKSSVDDQRRAHRKPWLHFLIEFMANRQDGTLWLMCSFVKKKLT